MIMGQIAPQPEQQTPAAGWLSRAQANVALREYYLKLSAPARWMRISRAFAKARKGRTLRVVDGEQYVHHTALGLPAEAAMPVKIEAEPFTPPRPESPAGRRYWTRLADWRRWQQFLASQAPGTTEGEARRRWQQRGLGKVIKTAAALGHWKRQVKRFGLAAFTERRGRPRLDFEPDEDAVAFFDCRYLNENRPTIAQAHRETSIEAAKRRWEWFALDDYAGVHRWAKDRYTQDQVVLNRQGERAYRRICQPTLTQDVERFGGGECYVGDHHQFPLWVTHNGRLIRPWLTAYFDYRSRAIVGWLVVPSPNQNSILAAARQACLSPDFGVPAVFLQDNGRDYRAWAFRGDRPVRRTILQRGYLDEGTVGGLFGLLGCDSRFVLPYSPNSKPIESWFNVLHTQLCKSLPTYCGRKASERPEQLVKRLADPQCVPSLEHLSEAVGKWIAAYNKTAQRGRYCGGRSPLQTLDATRTTKRVPADPKALDLLLGIWCRPVKVTRNGVAVRGVLYGQFDPALSKYLSKDVRVSFEPSDLGQVQVFDLDYGYITTATANRLYGQAVGDEHLRAAQKMMAKRKKALRVAQDTADLAFETAAGRAIAAKQRQAIAAAQQQQRQRRATGTDDARAEAPNVSIMRTPLDGRTAGIQRQAGPLKGRATMAKPRRRMRASLEDLAPKYDPRPTARQRLNALRDLDDIPVNADGSAIRRRLLELGDDAW